MAHRLNINLDELGSAFIDNAPDAEAYLDLETGEVIVITDELRQELHEIQGEMQGNEGHGPLSLDDVARQHDLPDRVRQRLVAARRVDAGDDRRFLAIPRLDSYDAYHDIEQFVGTLEDHRAREALRAAIGGPHPHLRFRETLDLYSDEHRRWTAFEAQRSRERMVEWLRHHGIEPVPDDGAGEKGGM